MWRVIDNYRDYEINEYGIIRNIHTLKGVKVKYISKRGFSQNSIPDYVYYRYGCNSSSNHSYALLDNEYVRIKDLVRLAFGKVSYGNNKFDVEFNNSKHEINFII